MSIARSNFGERLHALRLALQAGIIVSKAPVEKDHNARARLFRNGLAVTSFAIIEDFIKARIGEILNRLGGGMKPFSELPDGIKMAATSGVIYAVRFQERFLDKRNSNFFSFHQDHAQAIASTATVGGGYVISPLAFGHGQSNITSIEVKDILSAFGVENPWQSMGQISSKVNVGVVDLKSSFDTASIRRNEAAHRADAEIEITDLEGFVTVMLGITIGFDLLISKALRKILDYDRDYLSSRTKIRSGDISIRFIHHDRNAGWREVVDQSARAKARSLKLDTLKPACLQRAIANHQSVVITGERSLPVDWYTPETD